MQTILTIHVPVLLSLLEKTANVALMDIPVYKLAVKLQYLVTVNLVKTQVCVAILTITQAIHVHALADSLEPIVNVVF